MVKDKETFETWGKLRRGDCGVGTRANPRRCPPTSLSTEQNAEMVLNSSKPKKMKNTSGVPSTTKDTTVEEFVNGNQDKADTTSREIRTSVPHGPAFSRQEQSPQFQSSIENGGRLVGTAEVNNINMDQLHFRTPESGNPGDRESTFLLQCQCGICLECL